MRAETGRYQPCHDKPLGATSRPHKTFEIRLCHSVDHDKQFEPVRFADIPAYQCWKGRSWPQDFNREPTGFFFFKSTVIFKIIRKERDYTIISNSALEQPGLSFKAKGVLCYLLSKPDTWTPRVGQIASVGPDGKESIQTALKELASFGYAKLNTIVEDGQMRGKEWEIYESPLNATPPEIPDSGVSPSSGIPDSRETRSSGNPADSKTIRENNTKREQTGLSALGARVSKWFGRKPSTRWSEKELRALKAVEALKTPDEEIEFLEKYYLSDAEFKRRDIITLLNNWNGEIDRSKNENPKRTFANGIASPGGYPRRPSPADDRNARIIGADSTRAAIRAETANPTPLPWEQYTEQ